ncbi:MAG: WecB/TagA/CpsF family glycosyltransferase [Paracoccaceae bacterium]
MAYTTAETSRNWSPATHRQSGRLRFLGLRFSRFNQGEVLAMLAGRETGAPFAYLTTPNVQHVVVADQDHAMRPWLDEAWLSLCDSRPIRQLGRWSGLDLPLVTGSDLTVALFGEVVQAGDQISVICSSREAADRLRVARPDLKWDIMVPPQKVVLGTVAFAECVRFVADSQARFTFVSLGAPKSEAICYAARGLPGAKGTALCTGAALEFMLGLKRRAPVAVQRLGLEWLYRAFTEPKRLAGRYFSAMQPLMRIWLTDRMRAR